MYNKKGFTLVELIVVITILGILGIIGFLSFEGYVSNARDSVRISDLKSIELVLNHEYAKSGQYILPDSGTGITYFGAPLWDQGVFGETNFKSTKGLSEAPQDPLTKNYYTYSVANNRDEMELAAALENGKALSVNISRDKIYSVPTGIQTTHAANHSFSLTYILGNYNGQVIKTSIGGRDYVLALPSIIASDVANPEIESIISNNNLLINTGEKFPSSYDLEPHDTSPEKYNYVNESKIVVFSGSLSDLRTDETLRLTLASNLQKAFSGTLLSNHGDIHMITEAEISGTTGQKKADEIVKYRLGLNIQERDNSIDSGSPGEVSGGEGGTVGITNTEDFITVWKTDNSGFTSDNQIKLPLQSVGTYNFTVDWGDETIDTITSYNQAETTHTYASAETYTVTISGELEGFAFNEGAYYKDDLDDGDKLLDISQWGNIILGDVDEHFSNAENFTISATDTPDLSGMTSLNSMFAYARNFNSDISDWDTSTITDMSSLFHQASNFNQPLDSWNVSKVTTMYRMFSYAKKFNQDLNSWNLLELTDASELFGNTDDFNGNISNWTFPKLTSLSTMFYYASSFNGDISGWDIINVTRMYGLFYSATSFNQDIEEWDTSNVTSMRSTFYGASSFNQPLNLWNTDKVTGMDNMFNGAISFNQNIRNWNTNEVTNMSNMFNRANSFNQNIGDWNTGKVTNMYSLFSNATAFNQNIGLWDTSNVTNMADVFKGARAFNQYIGGWETGEVEHMNYMFSNASAFNQNIGLWDVEKVTGMREMFYNASLFNQNIGGWETGNVTNMHGTFQGADSFDQDISGWNTIKVNDMGDMFYGVDVFDQDISGWSVSSVTSCSRFSQSANVGWLDPEKPNFTSCTP